MNYRVDYNAIVSPRTKVDKYSALEREVEKCKYICLTDAIVSMNHGGSMMFEFLANEEVERLREGNPRKFKIKIIQDGWGTAPKPGDKIIRKITKPLRDKAGRKLRINHVHDLQRRGTFEKDYVIKREFVVDEKGCIECLFDDAGWFLTEYGVSFENPSMAICGRKEFSGGPCKCPDGSQKHVRYWRYMEAPPWVYETLPSLKQNQQRISRSERAE